MIFLTEINLGKLSLEELMKVHIEYTEIALLKKE
jgi:hypothetical protein